MKDEIEPFRRETVDEETKCNNGSKTASIDTTKWANGQPHQEGRFRLLYLSIAYFTNKITQSNTYLHTLIQSQAEKRSKHFDSHQV